MHIEQKQNRIFKPQSVYTYAAEECNQVSTELDNLITDGGLTPNAGDLTQVKQAVNNIVDTAANALQSQIDAITAASDVFDVVGTYAQLQAYDKSTVPLNDIIKVLQDSTHSNAATYYRLVETSGATEWQYIGQEGPYYTKSEIDTDFALKSELPSIATVSQVGLIKPDNQSTFVGNDGTLTIASNMAAALPLFTHIWSDHTINDASYLLADTFSWQSGSVYTEGYNHLVADISGITSQTETIGSYTITYYQATDGHKVVLADQETTVQNIYNSTGNARYFILDTTNTRFKLPRWKHNKYQAKAPVAGTGLTLGLTDGTNNFGLVKEAANPFHTTVSNNAYNTNTGTSWTGNNATSNLSIGVTTDITKSGIEATLEEDDMYLYFYVGNFTETATQQTAGLNSELFNGKADIDLNNISSNGKKVVFAREFTPLNITIATGGSAIAGEYTLSDLPNDNVIRLGMFEVYLHLTTNGGSKMALQTDVMSSASKVVATNNSFITYSTVLLPIKNKVTISFPETTGGVASDTSLILKGYI